MTDDCIFDIMASIVFAGLIAAGFVIVVGLGILPGWIARELRGVGQRFDRATARDVL